MNDLHEKLDKIASRGPGKTFWDYTLRMGFTIYPDSSIELFRYPSVPAHPGAGENPVPVPDDEFREFYKFVSKSFPIRNSS